MLNGYHDIIENSAEPKKWFVHLCMNYGINVSNHIGLTRVRQLEVLIPYLDYLDEMDLDKFSEECNRQGWFEFRKEYLDIRLKDKKKFRNEYLSIDNLRNIFDLLSESDTCWKVQYWIDDLLKTEVTVADVLIYFKKWLSSKDTIDSNIICFILNFLVKFGNRKQYSQFLEVFNSQKTEYLEEFENAFYLIRRRELR